MVVLEKFDPAELYVDYEKDLFPYPWEMVPKDYNQRFLPLCRKALLKFIYSKLYKPNIHSHHLKQMQ